MGEHGRDGTATAPPPEVVSTTAEQGAESPRPGPAQPPLYLRTARSPRMLVLLVLLLGAAAVCARLGVWQLDRAELRGEAAARAEQAELMGAPPAPLADVLAPQSPFSGDLVGQKVEVTGAFEDDPLLVAGRALDGRTGYLLLHPLRVDVAPGDAPVLPVVRGWVESPEVAAGLEPAPSGTVDLVGYLQAGEAAGQEQLPEGQVDAISSAELVNRWEGPIYSGYLVLAEIEPAQDPAIGLLPPPTAPGGGLNVQNLAYALQWWIFGGFAVFVWARLVRDEARAEVEQTEHPSPERPGG